MNRRRNFPWKRVWMLYPIDMACVICALTLSYELRFDWAIPNEDMPAMKFILVASVAIYSALFYLFGFYRRLWKYANERDLIAIIVANLIATLCVKGIDLYFDVDLPTSVWLTGFLCTLTAVAGTRLCWKVYTMDARRTSRKYVHPRRRTLVYGAGMAGAMVAKQITSVDIDKYDLVGFIDDDPSKRALSLQGVPILGAGKDVESVVKSYGVDEVIIAIPSLNRTLFRALVEEIGACGVAVSTVPQIHQWQHQRAGQTIPVRPVEVEDLLGRDVLPIDVHYVGDYLRNQVVLVTGGGGSIGSEICRQVSLLNPKQLVVLGRGENSVFDIQQELQERFRSVPITAIIANITDRKKMEYVFSTLRPNVVFHAAAHKHVPFMEYQPDEAFVNNVLGTHYLADLSVKYGVKKFVLISSDKAVRPTNVMGASKRISEMIVQSKRGDRTEFITVRFGNVLGSRGSVVPIFRKQIAKGGPITITDPRMERFFMTIPEAVRLVVEAGAIGRGGDVLLFDMGAPVRIVDLAERMIRLSGCEPGVDIDIQFTGIRPGEKLSEELASRGDMVETLADGRILKVRCPEMPSVQLQEVIERMYIWYMEEQYEQLASDMKELAWWGAADSDEGATRTVAVIRAKSPSGEVAYGGA